MDGFPSRSLRWKWVCLPHLPSTYLRSRSGLTSPSLWPLLLHKSASCKQHIIAEQGRLMVEALDQLIILVLLVSVLKKSTSQAPSRVGKRRSEPASSTEILLQSSDLDPRVLSLRTFSQLIQELFVHFLFCSHSQSSNRRLSVPIVESSYVSSLHIVIASKSLPQGEDVDVSVCAGR